MENRDKVLKVFKDAAKPLKTGEVVELSGLDKKEVAKVINTLKKEDLIYSPKRCFYEPK